MELPGGLRDLLVAAGANRVLAMTLHSPQVHGFFSVRAMIAASLVMPPRVVMTAAAIRIAGVSSCEVSMRTRIEPGRAKLAPARNEAGGRLPRANGDRAVLINELA